MDLMSYLLENYGYNEPIFPEDLRNNMMGKDTTLRQNLKRLTDREQIIRFDKGIYFIPRPDSLLKKKSLSVNKIIKKKYLYKEDKLIGYRTGLAFANDLNLTTQIPGMIEIITNKETNIKRVVNLKNRRVILRKPRINVTEKNYKLLQVLDLLTNYDKYSEKPLESAKQRIIDYLASGEMDQQEIQACIQSYPQKTKLALYESGLWDELTRR
ncbi:DUF6088 family protein [Jeotgalibacillus terrae]|uniref:DUF6088 family protein n=1 Tax=Jeotgalibacillus terrae TaxID=587735 RepID=A0ABW5ZLJ2_9BACL|nr:DUF6088 family protein [Jeotgalibacillus terrae]MBM7580812.1 hypothetical protein [Jeotgalibacillus terrae]